MTEKKLIAVVGATGSQGAGLVRAILADPDHELAVRALTCNADSPKAQALAAAGAEVVEADLDDEASMVKAFDGAHGAYIVTNHWAERTPQEEAARTRGEMELQQAEIAAWASKAAGVAHAVWSTLEAPGTTSATTTRCPPWRAGIRCRTSMPRARPTSCSPTTAYRQRSCGPRSISRG